ncbi:MAG: hypothetical protein PHY13_05365 [Clostridia bacterium]|nr:hypothetical protein [Clostridia bacterium]MDD3971854.1 hypothetical protein [Clostridia bacterium]MDD4543179.1 hypothetical protein [Clostridia bacterium]
MSSFVRSMSDELIVKLKKEELFTKYILPDIKKGKNAVFPAIRDKSIAFYYKGGGLFTYSNNGFKTHFKYGAIPTKPYKPYISTDDLKTMSLSNSFFDNYNEIKDRCWKYAGLEAEYVSDLYGYSGVSSSPIVLLDIEVCFDTSIDENPLELQNSDEFEPNKQKGKLDRIDILLYDKESRQLCFCEAKHFSNKELWAKKGNKPKVCTQVARYNQTIAKQHNSILKQYKNYVEKFNDLFGTSLPIPDKLYPKTGLVFFGFDNNQKDKIEELLIKDGSLDDIKYYKRGTLKGDTRNPSITTLYKAITK